VRQPAVPVRHGSETAISRTAGAFVTTAARFGRDAVLPAHYHDRPILAVTLAGGWSSTLGRTHFDLAPGDLHIEPAGDVHRNRFGAAGAEVLVLQPDPAERDLLDPAAPLLSSAIQIRLPTASRCAQALVRELACPDAISRLAIESLALELLTDACRARLAPPDPAGWLSLVHEYIREHFLEPVTMSELVRVSGVHPSHLGREFKRRFGRAPVAYLRRLRLEWAAQQIRTTGQPIAAIALAAGFCDQSHLTRAFTRFAGRPPASFRRAARRHHRRTISSR
jgi:AraC family transcriptional regulator